MTRVSSFALALFVVSGCGGEGSSPSQSQAPSLQKVASPVAECLAHSAHSHGIEGTGLRGVVTDVTDATVTVSTIVFDASTADVFVDGVCATLADVHPGATATVYGDFSDATHTGTATAIYVEEAVVGGIDAIDSAAGTMSVIGQSIVVTPATVLGDDIQPNQLSTLSAGEMVGVSGVRRPDGTLEATRIRRWPQDADFAVAGVVTTIDPAKQLLQVGGVTVLYTEAQLVNFPDATIHTGDYVRALGQNLGVVSGFENTPGVDAWVIQRAVIPIPDPSKNIVLQGAMNVVRADDDFDVAGQPVKMTSGTHIAGQGMATSWGPVFLTVFGSLDPSGYVIADLVVPQNGGSETAGPITTIDRNAHTLAIMGVPVQLSSFCFLADGTGHATTLDTLKVGDYLDVVGSSLNNSSIDCLIARHYGPSNEARVAGGGPFGSHRPILVMEFGIRVDTTNWTGSRADAFWNLGYWRSVSVSSHAVGTWTGDHIDATEVYWEED